MEKVRKGLVAAAALLMLLLATQGAFAQAENARVELFASGSVLKGERSFVIDGDPKRSNFATGGKIGVRFTVDMTPHLALEGAYSYGTNNLRIIDVGPPAVTRGFGTRIHQLTGNASYYFTDAKSGLRPFATAGAGIMRFNPTGDARSAATIKFVSDAATIQSNTKLEFNYGGGVEAGGERLGLRFDLRDHIAGIPRFGVPQAPAAGIADFFPVSGSIHDVEASVGVVYYFGH
jgi:hypothetical protein